RVYLNSDDKLLKELQKTYEDRNLKKRIPIKLKIKGRVGSPLELEVWDEKHHICVQSEGRLSMATSSPLDKDLLIKNLAGLTQTAYVADRVEVDLEGKLFLPNFELKSLKKQFVK